MSVTALLWGYGLILLIGLYLLFGLRDVWRDLFKGGDRLGALVDRRYPGR